MANRRDSSKLWQENKILILSKMFAISWILQEGWRVRTSGSQSGSSPTSQGEALEEGTAGTTAPPGTPASHVQISPRRFWEMEGPGAMLLTWKIVGLLLPTAGGPIEPGRVEPQDPSITYPLPQPWKSPTNVTGFG